MAQSEFCTTTTIQNKTSLIGTASANTSIWFLLEVPRPWAAKALVENNLPDAVNSTLNSWVTSTPKSRAVFIKKNNRPVASPTLYIAITEDNDQRIYQYNLRSDYSDLPAIPLDSLLENSTESANLFQEKLYLVCTNGKRDNCCTKFGLPIIKAFEDEKEPNVWRCTHLGGHKFSAVVGVYPSGLYYQLFNPADVPAFKQTIEQNEVPLKGLRGRTAYPGAAQAAEYFLRQHTGDLEINSYSLVSAEDQGNSWQVVFQNGIKKYSLNVSLSLSEPTISGCNGKLKPSPRYELLSIK
ncbi:MAG: sucrase ferredoxin [Anaerolineae bacterium]